MRFAWIISGVVALAVGLGFVCPQLAQLRLQPVVPLTGILLLVGGLLLTWGGVWSVARGIRGAGTRSS